MISWNGGQSGSSDGSEVVPDSGGAGEAAVQPGHQSTDVCKGRAAAVVMAFRAVDWDAVEGGDKDAVAGLVAACDQHELTRQFLESQLKDSVDDVVASKLVRGLMRFYDAEVAPRLSRPAVVRQMIAVAEPPSMAGASQNGANRSQDEGLAPRRRPSVTVGHTMRMNTGCGNLYVTVNEDGEGTPFELFNHMGKAGGCAASQNEAIGRLISYALRCGASIEPLIKQLKGISCHRPAWSEDGKISSCADAIGKALEKYHVSREVDDPDHPMVIDGGAGPDVPDEAPPVSMAALKAERRRLSALMTSTPSSEKPFSRIRSNDLDVQGACRDCGSQLAYEEGCVKCHSCGFTECG